MKCIDDEIPFELPNGWEWCRLGEVGELINGRAYKKEELLKTGKYRVLRVGNLFTNNEWFYSNLELPKEKYCQAGDLLYAWSASFGPYIWNGPKTIFHYHIWNVIYNQSIVTRDYLYYFLELDKSRIRNSTTGTTMIHISMENMNPRFIPLPPLAEQQRIVAKIEELMPLVEQYGKAQSELNKLNTNIREQLKKSILQYAIEGKLVPQCEEDGTAEDLLQEIQAEKQRLYAEGKLKKKDLTHSTIFRGEDNKYYEKTILTGEVKCIDDEIPLELPKGWEWCRIKDICTMQAGKNISASVISKEKSLLHQYKCIGGNGLRGYVKDYNTEGFYSIVGRQGALCGGLHIEKGKFYATEPAVIVDSWGIISPVFMYYILTALNLNQYSTATAQPGLSVAKIITTIFPLPPLAEQQRIVDKIKLLFDRLK